MPNKGTGCERSLRRLIQVRALLLAAGALISGTVGPSSAQAATLRGYIVSLDDGQGLSYAAVHVLGTSLHAETELFPRVPPRLDSKFRSELAWPDRATACGWKPKPRLPGVRPISQVIGLREGKRSSGTAHIMRI